jgi:hypothetical protein
MANTIELNHKPTIGFFKVGYAVGNAPLDYNYIHIITPSKHHMDLAVKNYIHKYGIREMETVPQEEYEKHKQ